MNISDRTLSSYVDNHVDRLVELTQSLVRLPSENKAPLGSEWECQQYAAGVLQQAGWQPILYTPDTAPGIQSHPLFWPGRQYDKRPNVAAKRAGTGGGRSLILSGHIDTVPIGAEPWTRLPFGAAIEGNRLYGRGSNDMKAGVAVNLFVAEALAGMGLALQGDLTIETVVDEEFGGVNGTLAGRLMGFTADAAIISEPTSLRVCPAQRGGRTIDITFQAPNQGILSAKAGAGVIDQLRVFLDELPQFAEVRRVSGGVHPLYAHLENAVPVSVSRIQTAPWGTSEPPNVPPICRVELFWQAMPGETVDKIDREFAEWFDALLQRHAEVFTVAPLLEHPIRWLAGSAMPTDAPFVTEFAACAESVLERRPTVAGIEGPCDMYVFHEFGIPALLWGAHGGNTHMPDEYVEIDSVVQSAKVLLAFVCDWCGVEGR